MADPFLSEIRLFSFHFAPRGWAQCNGQLLPINQNQALFSLLGTTYGGDGRTNFSLPDLRGRSPMGVSDTHVLGERAGAESHALALAEMPAHGHPVPASLHAGQSASPTGNLPAMARGHYASGSASAAVAGNSASVGQGQAHTNMPPYLALNFCIALQGIFPSPT